MFEKGEKKKRRKDNEYDVVELLLAKGALLAVKNEVRDAGVWKEDVIEILLAKGASVAVKDDVRDGECRKKMW